MPFFGRKTESDIPELAPETPHLDPDFELPEPPPPRADGLRGMAEHRDYLLSMIEPLMPFGMQLLDGLGLALCEDIRSTVALPGFDNSAMDGYAVRAVDIAGATPENPVRLPVAGVIAAGGPTPGVLVPGTALRIMTGAPIPAGADAVVQFEYTDRGAEQVFVGKPVPEGSNIRRYASDVAIGELLVRQGSTLDARTVGVLAGVGVDKVLARPRPRVVVVATGSELVEPGHELSRPGQVFDANSYLIAAAARAEGAQVWRVSVVGDDMGQIKQTISDQLIRADLVITSGGVSEGDYDLVKRVVPQLGPTDFCRVAMQPGKPQGFGLVGDDHVPIVMMPGNPVSAYVSFEAFVRPIIRKLMGAEPYVRTPVKAVAKAPMRSRPGVMQLARGRVWHEDENRMVELVGGHSSHLLGDLANSNALVLLGEDVSVVEAGDEVEVWLLDES